MTVDSTTTLGDVLANNRVVVAWENLVTTGQDDMTVTLRDGTTFGVNFDGLNNSSELGDPDNQGTLLYLLNQAQPGLFTAALADKRMVMQDHTSPAGQDPQFSVKAAGGSLVALVLGLLGQDDDGDGELAGMPLHGDTLAGHALIEPLGNQPFLEGQVSFSPAGIDATALFGGLTDLEIADGFGSIYSQIEIGLNDLDPQRPGNTLTELTAQLNHLGNGCSAMPATTRSMPMPIPTTAPSKVCYLATSWTAVRATISSTETSVGRS